MPEPLCFPGIADHPEEHDRNAGQEQGQDCEQGDPYLFHAAKIVIIG
jgi:hypothetical protein